MYRSHIDADRFFARIRTLDLACPDCDEVYIARRNRSVFDPAAGRFTCTRCGATYILGTYAYRTTYRYRGGTTPAGKPSDQNPTPAESLALRGNLADAKSPGRPPLAPGEKGNYHAPGMRRLTARQKRRRIELARRGLDLPGGLLDRQLADRKHTDPTNIVVRGECRCLVDEEDGRVTIAPDCPMHSISRGR